MEDRTEPTSGRRDPRRTGKVSRPLLIAMALILAGAAFLFWPRGGGQPDGIGEQYSTVTADQLQADASTSSPRSGDVAIEEEIPALVPEKPGAGETQVKANPTEAKPAEGKPAATQQAATKPAAPKPSAASAKPVADKPSATSPTGTASSDSRPTADPQPQATGSWALQIAAFNSDDNAAKLMRKLQGEGYQPLAQSSNTANGQMLYKVWIGYFRTRDEAQAYVRLHRGDLGDALPVHR
jgi:cell division septation protein DedD